MQPKTIDAVIDDYLHKIVRNRSWTKAREERLLTPFADWLYEQPEHGVMLADAGPASAARYADMAGLSGDEREELWDSLRRVFAHGARNGWIGYNPFEDAVAV